jgi:hypothetical protein
VGARLVAITGNQAMGAVGDFGVFYWSLIDDSENANWQNITNTQTAGWALIDDAEAPGWVIVNTT